MIPDSLRLTEDQRYDLADLFREAADYLDNSDGPIKWTVRADWYRRLVELSMDIAEGQS